VNKLKEIDLLFPIMPFVRKIFERMMRNSSCYKAQVVASQGRLFTLSHKMRCHYIARSMRHGIVSDKKASTTF
jgi:hypothetical protein